MEDLIFKTIEAWSEKSKCQGSHVAAAAVYNNRLLGIGYNGTPKKTCNCNEVFKKIVYSISKCSYYVVMNHELALWASNGGFELIKSPDDTQFINCVDYVGEEKAKELFSYLHGKWSDKYEVHAEMNLVFNLLRQGCIIPMEEMIIYTNISPCSQCLKNLAGLGVKEIHFKEVYWRSDPEDLYRSANELKVSLFYKGQPFTGKKL